MVTVTNITTVPDPLSLDSDDKLEALWSAGRNEYLMYVHDLRGMGLITAIQGDYISLIYPMSFINMDPTNINTIYAAILTAI